MQITTLGAALEFAGELEQAAQTFHTQAAGSAQADDLQAVLTALSESNGRRQMALRRLYDDNVYSDMDTGILAPITSMIKADYTPPLAETAPATDREIIERALGYERTLYRFYGDLTPRLQSGPRPIMRRIDKLAREVLPRLRMLEEL
jgi:hypothetical protein